MKIITTDNNEWISNVTGKPLNAKGKVVREGDPDAIPNPAYGTTTETDVPDPPSEALSWDAFDFKMRFTAAERKAIRAAAKVDGDMEDFVDMLDTAAATQTRIHADNPLVVAALDAMTPAILAEGRKAEILGG